MYFNDQHTPRDLAAFEAAGIDPATREPRKQPTTCRLCPPRSRPTVWNRSGLCDYHEDYMEGLSAAVGVRPARTG